MLAGSAPGFVDGPAGTALFAEPSAVAVDARGAVIITDKRNHAVRVLDPTGMVRTLAGGGQGYMDGNGREARFAEPLGVAVAADGTLYVADAANHRIRRIRPDGAVTTLAGSGASRRTDGQGADAAFFYPLSLALTPRGDLLVVDYANDAIRLVTIDGHVTTLAGGNLSGFQDDAGPAARFDSPAGITVDRAGVAYVADEHNHRIRRIDPDGNVTTLAGRGTAGSEDGPAATARFNQPKGIAVTDTGTLYVTDFGSGALRRVAPDGLVSTIRLAAPLEAAHGLALSPDGALILAESGKNRILSIPPGLLL